MHLKRGPALRQYDTLDCSALSKTRRVTQTSFIDTLVAEARRRNAGRVHGDVRRQSDAGFRKLHICRTKNVYTINRRVNNPGREKKTKREELTPAHRRRSQFRRSECFSDIVLIVLFFSFLLLLRCQVKNIVLTRRFDGSGLFYRKQKVSMAVRIERLNENE